MSSALKLQKKYLVPLGSWLNDQKLTGAASRARTRMVEMIVAGVKTFEDDKNALIGSVVNKEEDGKTWKKIAGVDNLPEKWDIDADKLPELEAQYQELSEEFWVLDVQESNREVLKQTRDILLNTDYLFGPQEKDSPEERVARVRQMNEYPIWCDAFETLDLTA